MCCYWCAVDDEGIHILDDGNFYYEVEGLAEVDDLDEEDSPFQATTSVPAKKPDKVKFSSSPMKVCSSAVRCLKLEPR